MPYERKLRQSRKAVLLAELEAGDAIEVTCTACRHSSLIAAARAAGARPRERGGGRGAREGAMFGMRRESNHLDHLACPSAA